MGIRAGSRWPFTRQAHHAPDKFEFGGYLPFPHFLAASAAYTQNELPESNVVIRDSIARGEGYSEFLAAVKYLKPEFLIMETASPSWDHDKMMITALMAHPNTKVILCGPIDAKDHQPIFDTYHNVCAILLGEYDRSVTKAILHLRAGGPRQVFHHDLLSRVEMNEAPFPMFDEEAAANYWDGCPIGHKPEQLTVWTSRGCIFKCCFCVWPATMTGNDPDGLSHRTVRQYSPLVMDRLIRYRIAIAEAHGRKVESIYLDDDTFNLGHKHTRAICEVMKGIGLPWSAMCRADFGNPKELKTVTGKVKQQETWLMMRDAGCFGVKNGFESGSQRVVDEIINKHLDLQDAAEACRFIRSLGMSVHGTFTIGLPGEKPFEAEITRLFIKELYYTGAIDTHQLSGTAEIAGTPLAAIGAGAKLETFPGAELDNNYHPSNDGQRKAETLKTISP